MRCALAPRATQGSIDGPVTGGGTLNGIPVLVADTIDGQGLPIERAGRVDIRRGEPRWPASMPKVIAAGDGAFANSGLQPRFLPSLSHRQRGPMHCNDWKSRCRQSSKWFHPMPDLTHDERLALTQRTMSLLESWNLSASDMMVVLQLPDSVKPRNISRFREEEPFPDTVEVNRRVAYLLRIEEALHTYFPRNPEMRGLWVQRGNKQFGKRAPVAVMVEDGESGLIAVLSHLDCTFAWELTGSKTAYEAAS